ncbi:MAG: alpha/beta fold hydrolase [Chloroflexi bacterium]|nr:alpha/beta fold hydrolase [Chloroflexota bacterium]MBU1747704.1 alpha/beta fold hydrolase [Chloroflexota bacterium]MBU1879346.1 alpha/beta fold hydrolase [Chloroflexota bacterium]
MGVRRVVFLGLFLVLAALMVWAGWLGLRWLEARPARHALAANPAQEYYLYVPPGATAEDPAPIMVVVHGTGGSGADMYRIWQPAAEQEGFCLVCPSFGPGYHRLEAGADESLLAILDEVAREQPAARGGQPVLLVGFSGGAQFVHRWAFRHPGRVCGVAALSAGAYDPPPRDATRRPPFLVSVGSVDTGPPNRVTLARWFHEALVQAGYEADLRVYEGVGHRLCDAAIADVLTFYQRVWPK